MSRTASYNILHYKDLWQQNNKAASPYRNSVQNTLDNAVGKNPNANKEQSSIANPNGNVQKLRQYETTGKGYAKAAQPYYDELRKNGDSAVADYLENNDFNNSKNFLSTYYGDGSDYNSKQATAQLAALKKKWDNLTAAGDTEGAKAVSAQGQGLYALMRKNGDEVLAGNLEKMGYNDANKYLNSYYTIQGLTPTRSYLYSLGNKMGLSNRDIDNQLRYDDKTGEVYLGGKSMGKAKANVDGVSYYDAGTLDSAFKDYVDRAGITTPKEQLAQQSWQKLMGYYDDYQNLKEENPFTNEVGKSILGKYDLSGYRAGQGAAASAAASNGGNIDSFSAANAMRNQLAMVAAGQEKALEAQNQKLTHAREVLANMGVDVEKLFNASETEKNNKVNRDVSVMNTTGNVMPEYTYAENPYLNADGTLKNENLDYKAIMNDAREKLKDEKLDENERKNLQTAINYAAQARGIKLGSKYNSDGRYSGYDDGDYVYNLPKTENARQFDESGRLERDITKMNNDTSLAISDGTNATNLALNKDTANAQAAMNNATIAGGQKQLETSLAAQAAESEKDRNAQQKLFETQLAAQTSNTGNSSTTLTVDDFVKFFNGVYGKGISTDANGKYVVSDDSKYKVLAAITNVDSISADNKNALRKALSV